MWCMVPEIWSATDRIFCHYGPFFALLPPYGPRKLKFWKIKKTLQDIIILQMFTINDSHMIYGFSDIEWNRQNLFVILDRFFPFTPLTTWKIKILKDWKKPLEISSFYTRVSKIMIICYTVPDIWRMTDVIIGAIFLTFCPPNNPENQNFEKIIWRCRHFTHVFQKSQS